MGQSEYSKLMKDVFSAKRANEKFKFRLIPNGKTFLLVLGAAGLMGIVTYLCVKVFVVSTPAYVFFAATCFFVFLIGVMLLLSITASIVWLINKARLKHNIKKLRDAQDKDKRNFEEKYFTTLIAETDNKIVDK